MKATMPRFFFQTVPTGKGGASKWDVFGMFVIGGPGHAGPTVTAAQIMGRALGIKPHHSRASASERRQGCRSHSPKSDHDDKVGLHGRIVTSTRQYAEPDIGDTDKKEPDLRQKTKVRLSKGVLARVGRRPPRPRTKESGFSDRLDRLRMVYPSAARESLLPPITTKTKVVDGPADIVIPEDVEPRQ